MLKAALGAASAKLGKDGATLPEGRTLTLHASRGGAGLSVSKVEWLKVEGSFLSARNVKGEIYFLSAADIYAIAVDGTDASTPGRRAGFLGT